MAPLAKASAAKPEGLDASSTGHLESRPLTSTHMEEERIKLQNIEIKANNYEAIVTSKFIF